MRRLLAGLPLVALVLAAWRLWPGLWPVIVLAFLTLFYLFTGLGVL